MLGKDGGVPPADQTRYIRIPNPRVFHYHSFSVHKIGIAPKAKEKLVYIAMVKNRFPALDSLRGICAFGVLLTHLFQTVTPNIILNHTPFRILTNGRSFVIFFFVLSGFVLSNSIRYGRHKTYTNYALSRLLRLYPPYAVAGILAAVSIWYFQSKLDVTQLLNYLAATGTKSGVGLNSPSWSLVYEMRLSLILPLICLIIDKNIWISLAICVFLFLTEEFFIVYSGIGQYPYSSNSVFDAIVITCRFAVCFFIGALIPVTIINIDWECKARIGIILLLVAAVLLSILLDQFSILGSVLIIFLAIKWQSFENTLNNPLFLWMGQISYSLYLTHVVVLHVILSVFEGAPAYLFFLIYLPFAFFIAVIFNQLVEKPALYISQRIKPAEK